MKVGLLDFGKKGFPNLALMKLSAYHKSLGDEVGLLDRIVFKPDRVYVSVPFSWNLQNALGIKLLYPEIDFRYGGSGYSFDTLPDVIEHILPDYGLYPIDFSMGFTSRGCVRKCEFCIVPSKEGFIHDHAPLTEFLNPYHRKVMLLDNNLLATPSYRNTLLQIRDLWLKVDFNQGLDIRLVNRENAALLADIRYYGYPDWSRRTLRFAFDNMRDKPLIERGIQYLLEAGIKASHLFFYILAGFDSTVEEDVARVELIKSYGSVPFIMKYNRKTTKHLNKLAKWVNHIPYYQVYSFGEFNPLIRRQQ